jgi:translation initiation factor IF-3
MEDGEQLGILSRDEALRVAQEKPNHGLRAL